MTLLEVPVAVRLPEGRVVRAAVDGPVAELRTTPFEVLRLRLGRRSRSQVAAMDWSVPPGDALDGLFVFGPTPVALDEPG